MPGAITVLTLLTVSTDSVVHPTGALHIRRASQRLRSATIPDGAAQAYSLVSLHVLIQLIYPCPSQGSLGPKHERINSQAEQAATFPS